MPQAGRALCRVRTGSAPSRAVAPGSGKVDCHKPGDAADAGADQQHGHKEARGDGAARCPDRPGKVEHQHDHQRRIAKLPVRPPRQQVLDRVLACA